MLSGSRAKEILTRPGKLQLWRLPWSAQIGLVLLLAMVVVAAVPDAFAPFSPTKIGAGPPQTAPNWAHPFGTDQLGRDVFSRVVWGTRVAVFVALTAIAAALIAGAIFGSLAALSRGWVNAALLRFLELSIAFPVTIVAVVLATALQPGAVTTVVVLAIIYTPAIARVVRGNILNQLAEDYVTAERTFGASRYWILVRHVRLNMTAPVLVFATVIVAEAILAEAALSFIGVGIQPPTASWGNIVADGRDLINSGGWWVSTFGGLVIFLAVIAINAVAEGMADAISAPTALGSSRGKQGNAFESNELRDERSVVEQPYEQVPIDKVVLLPAQPGEVSSGRSPLLSIENLSIKFSGVHGDIDLVSDFSIDVAEHERVGLIGESGSGKSLTALAVMGLLPTGAQVTGAIMFRGNNILTMSERQRRAILGREIAMIYQDALSALNPAMRIESQLLQLCRRGSKYTPQDLMTMVGLPDPALLRAYPHQMSGGQRQRVLIAMALSRDPILLIADEPTTALDQTVQAQIIELLEGLAKKAGMALLLISHDLGLIAANTDRIAVMYAGQLAEMDVGRKLLTDPRHPYTCGLLGSILSLELQEHPLSQIRGNVPSPSEFVEGCRFHDRCRNATSVCEKSKPVVSIDGSRRVACHHPVQRWLRG